jgi:hypothetical protein
MPAALLIRNTQTLLQDIASTSLSHNIRDHILPYNTLLR